MWWCVLEAGDKRYSIVVLYQLTYSVGTYLPTQVHCNRCKTPETLPHAVATRTVRILNSKRSSHHMRRIHCWNPSAYWWVCYIQLLGR